MGSILNTPITGLNITTKHKEEVSWTHTRSRSGLQDAEDKREPAPMLIHEWKEYARSGLR